MAVVLLTSASGSPGVTTTALGLALVWPRPVVLVEADPTGGSSVLAGYFQGAVVPAASLVDLVFAHRDGRLQNDVETALLQLPGTTARLLPGVRSHAQSRSVGALWSPLIRQLRSLEDSETDVLVDAGRLGLQGWPLPLLEQADLALLTVRSDLVALAGARGWAEDWQAACVNSDGRRALLVVGEGRPYSGGEISEALGLPMIAALAWDPRAAEVLAHGAPPNRRFQSSALVRGLRAAAGGIDAALARTVEDAAAPTTRSYA